MGTEGEQGLFQVPLGRKLHPQTPSQQCKTEKKGLSDTLNLASTRRSLGMRQLAPPGHEREAEAEHTQPGHRNCLMGSPQVPAILQAAFPPPPVDAHNAHMQEEQSWRRLNFHSSQHRGMTSAQTAPVCSPSSGFHATSQLIPVHKGLERCGGKMTMQEIAACTGRAEHGRQGARGDKIAT